LIGKVLKQRINGRCGRYNAAPMLQHLFPGTALVMPPASRTSSSTATQTGLADFAALQAPASILHLQILVHGKSIKSAVTMKIDVYEVLFAIAYFSNDFRAISRKSLSLTVARSL
jgi:hypothetical protein